MKREFYTDEFEHIVFNPETEEEREELKAFENYLAITPVHCLCKRLSDEPEAWKAYMIAGQIMDDVIDCIETEELYQ